MSVGPPAIKLSYINGSKAAPVVSKSAYMPSAGNATKSLLSFINTINAQTNTKSAFVLSTNNLSANRSAYIPVLSDVGAIRFVGASQQYAKFTADPHFDLNQFTIDLWVRIRTSYSTNDGYKPLWYWLNNASLYFDQDASHFFIDGTFGGTYYRSAQSIQTLASLGGFNRWIKFTTTYDRSVYRLYINGVLACAIPTSGGIVGTDPSDFYLGAQPASNRYTDTDMACFTISNFAKSATQVANEFSPQNRIVSKPAYITSPLPVVLNRTINRSCFITGSPLLANRNAYLVAGGEAIKSFDLEIEILPPTTYKTTTYFDTVIRFSAGPRVIVQYAGPLISYPITRQIINRIPIHSKDAPVQFFSTQSVYLHAGFSLLSQAKPSYIVSSNPRTSSTAAFISGQYNSRMNVKLLYIQGTTTISSTVYAYINSNLATTRSSSVNGYIAGTVNSAFNSKQSYIPGQGILIASKLSYITTASHASSTTSLFLNAHTISIINSSHPSYIVSYQSRIVSINSYIFGAYLLDTNKNAYISVINFSSSNKLAYIIYSIAAPFSSVYSFIDGFGSSVSSKTSFLMATLNLVGSKSCYVGGYSSVPDGLQKAFIEATPIFSTGSKSSYINNLAGSSTVSISGYIYNLGTSTNNLVAYIACALIYGSKNTYIRGISNLSSIEFGYVHCIVGTTTVSKSGYISA